MIYRLFKRLGYFAAFSVYWVLASPLVVGAATAAILSFLGMRTRNVQIILRDETWRSKPLRWVNALVWPNGYLGALEKITGYYP